MCVGVQATREVSSVEHVRSQYVQCSGCDGNQDGEDAESNNYVRLEDVRGERGKEGEWVGEGTGCVY